jgi:hypothetical protein
MSLHLLRLMIYRSRLRRKKTGEKKAGRRTSKKTKEGEKYTMWGRRWHSLHDQFTLTV